MFGKLIKERRKEKGLTQQQLADLCKLPRKETISDIETGKSAGSIRVLLAILKALDIELIAKEIVP